MIQRYVFTCLFLACTLLSLGQELSLAHSLNLVVSFPRKFKFIVSYNVNLTAPVALTPDFALTPLADLKISVSHNHLGSSVLKAYRKGLTANFAFTYGALSSGIKAEEAQFLPLYTTTFANAFNQHYRLNLGFSSTYAWQTELSSATDKIQFSQKIGGFLVSVNDAYLTIFNDGGPLLHLFGDGEDRYWTGSIIVGYNYRHPDGIHQIEVLYDKFTGFTNGAFEAAGLLQVDNVAYAQEQQFSLNTGRFGLRYINHQTGLGLTANLWNLPVDLQDWIHKRISNDPYHHKIEKSYFDLELSKTYLFQQ